MDDLLRTNPLALLASDRALAKQHQDPLWQLGFLATHESDHAFARTVVLRDLPNGLAIFINGTSPKSRQIANGGAELLIYLPTQRLQYRLRMALREVEADVLAAHWALRPAPAKLLDHLYLRHPQSTPIAREQLTSEMMAGEPADNMPASARGLYIDATQVDRLLIDDAHPPHPRVRYRLAEGTWQGEWLMP